MSQTANLKITHLEANQNQPEAPVNAAADVEDAALAGLFSVDLADANYTLATTGTVQEWHNSVIECSGALTAARDVIVPANNKRYLLKNSTTGGFAVQLKTSAGTGISVAAGRVAELYCDGTNIIRLSADIDYTT